MKRTLTYETCSFVKNNKKLCLKKGRTRFPELNGKLYCYQHLRIMLELDPSLHDFLSRYAYKHMYCAVCGHMRQYHAHGRCWICRDGQGERHEFSEKPTVLEGDNGS